MKRRVNRPVKLQTRLALIDALERRQLFQAAPLPVDPVLTATDVSTILAQAASQALTTQAIVIEDRNGTVLGEYDGSALTETAAMAPNQIEEIREIRVDAALEARTASFFESENESFTTRTARFIIQDHFPDPIQNTPGGPLYGVQFSSAISTDILPINQPTGSPFLLTDPDTDPSVSGKFMATLLTPGGLSGDPGGIPLYIMGIDSSTGKREPIPVGSIGVAGDMSTVAARKNLELGADMLPDGTHEFQYAFDSNPNGNFFQGNEKGDFDESVALAGANGFMAPKSIQATQVFVAGLRLPFVASPVAHKNYTFPVELLTGTVPVAPVAAAAGTGLDFGTPFTITTASRAIKGHLVRRDTRESQTLDAGFVSSNDTDPTTGAPLPTADILTADDVDSIIDAAASRAATIRAGIRVPIGGNPKVYISVVDRDGDLLGSFGFDDATNFSYDVSVQKARTAAFFSDDTHAFSDTAMGFISQRYFAPGINNALEGPLFDLQNGLVTADLSSTGTIVDDTMKPVGTITAAVSAAAIAAGQLIPASALSGQSLTTGQIVTFGTDPTFATRAASNPLATSDNDTSNEYVITSVSAAGITVREDDIDTDDSAYVQAPIAIAAGDAIIPKNPIKDGITIFPGGFPLYKNGQMVGAIGVSGDGVVQDDVIAYSGTGAKYQSATTGLPTAYRPPMGFESDALSANSVANFIGSKVTTIESLFDVGSAFTDGQNDASSVSSIEQRLQQGLQHERLPYVKFPRNPNI